MFRKDIITSFFVLVNYERKNLPSSLKMVRLLTNLIEKKRFEKLHKPKAPLCRSEGGKPPTNLPAAKFALPTKSGEGLFLDKRRLFVAIPPSFSCENATSLYTREAWD